MTKPLSFLTPRVKRGGMFVVNFLDCSISVAGDLFLKGMELFFRVFFGFQRTFKL